MHLTIVIPAYNEAKKIGRDLVAATSYLESKPPSEILVVDDGSQDSTPSAVEEFIRGYGPSNHTVRVLRYGSNRGKGYAVRFGISQSTGKFVAFVDAGLCAPFSFLDSGIAKLNEGFDFAIASRRLSGARITNLQPHYRRIGSIVFWRLMRSTMGIDVTDTQCGFKIYRGFAARKIYGNLKTDGFMFDIEALRVARRLGYRGTEFPIKWSSDQDSRFRLVSGTWRNFLELTSIRTRELFIEEPS